MDHYKLEAISYRIDAGNAEYVLHKVDGEFWEAQRQATGRLTSIAAQDEDGEPVNWNTLDEAHRACVMHADLCAIGRDVDMAALDVQRDFWLEELRKAPFDRLEKIVLLSECERAVADADREMCRRLDTLEARTA